MVEVQLGAEGECNSPSVGVKKLSKKMRLHFLLEFQDEVFLILMAKRATDTPQRSAH